MRCSCEGEKVERDFGIGSKRSSGSKEKKPSVAWHSVAARAGGTIHQACLLATCGLLYHQHPNLMFATTCAAVSMPCCTILQCVYCIVSATATDA